MQFYIFLFLHATVFYHLWLRLKQERLLATQRSTLTCGLIDLELLHSAANDLKRGYIKTNVPFLPLDGIYLANTNLCTQLLFQQNALVFIKSTRYYNLYFLSLYS
jgi:hypothetical protein